jgi:protein SCO1/2/putative membrane protein
MSRRWLVVVALTALLGLGSTPLPQNNFDPLYDGDLGPVADFHFTDQLGRPLSRDDLRGKVWVASFFYSTCKECSKHQWRMAELQEQLAGWPGVMLVSFSVDPAKDTPAQMELFARGYSADPNRWLFVTGPESEMYELIRKSFRQAVEPSPEPEPGAEFDHSFRFMLVDDRGNIRGYVDAKENPHDVPRIGERVKKLVQARYLPSVNASLNGLAGMLLVIGYVFVRRRRILLHQVCMWAALSASALFLASYLYYHFGVLDGRPTYFAGEGWVRPVYFGVLLSHTALAVIVAPLALVTAYLGVTNRLARHRGIARVTLPLWLYVSVTGVVVYFMLYHLYTPA